MLGLFSSAFITYGGILPLLYFIILHLFGVTTTATIIGPEGLDPPWSVFKLPAGVAAGHVDRGQEVWVKVYFNLVKLGQEVLQLQSRQNDVEKS